MSEVQVWAGWMESVKMSFQIRKRNAVADREFKHFDGSQLFTEREAHPSSLLASKQSLFDQKWTVQSLSAQEKWLAST